MESGRYVDRRAQRTGAMGYQDIELDRTLSYELNSGHLGGEVEGPGFVARVADGPIATSLPETLTAAGKAIPKTLSLYERFGVWIVPHRLAIIRRKGLAEPVAVGVQIQYVVDGTCSILGLFPSFEYRVVGEIGGNFHAELGASGEIGAALSPDVAGVDSSSVGANLGSLKVGIRTGATIGLDLSCSVSTSIISAS